MTPNKNTVRQTQHYSHVISKRILSCQVQVRVYVAGDPIGYFALRDVPQALRVARRAASTTRS